MAANELPALALEGWQVSLIYIDYAFGFVLEAPAEGEPAARVRIGGAFDFRGPDGASHHVVPGPPQLDVAPALALHNQVVLAASVSAEGTLAISFADGGTVTVAPDPHYEAWELQGPRGSMVCMPGGDVAFWPAEPGGADSV